MPVQQGKSLLLSKLGDRGRKAAAKHQYDEPDYGNMELPAGIEGGVAQLVDCKFDTIKEGKQNAGALFFYAAGVVVSPEEFGGVGVAGMRTSIMEVIADTPDRSRKTVEDHLAWVQNQLKLLGVAAEDLGAEDLESSAAMLKESQPHFRFRTWKGDKQTTGPYKDREPRVQHQWNGLVTDFASNGQAAVDDRTTGSDAAEESQEETEAASDSDADGATAELVEAANGKGKEADAARLKLAELAMAAGASEADVESAADWQAVADLIGAGGSGEGAAEEEPAGEEPWAPEKGQVYAYCPIDPKTKRPVKKAVDVEVTAVDGKTETVTLKNVATPKLVYKNVKWTDLESAG